jgi:hypothetical protein
MKYVILLLCILPSVLAIHINEIMFNPLGSDTTEYVEIQGTNNLTDYFIGDSASNDSLGLLQYIESDYSLIVTDAYNYSGLHCSVYSAGSSIGNHLNNDQDTLYLYAGNLSNGTLIDAVSYINAIPEGYSLELYNNTWKQSLLGGSPCLDNMYIYNSTNGTENITNSSNTTINNNTTNTTINISNTTNTTNSSCTISILLTTDKEIYTNKEQIAFYNHVNTTQPFIIEYWVEDLFGNIIKPKINTTNENKKTYTPDVDEKDKVLIFKNRISQTNCVLLGNATSSKIIIITNEAYTPVCPACSCPAAKTTKETCPMCKETKCLKETTLKKEDVIESFYTRAEKTNQNITVYANIKGNSSQTLSIYAIKKIADVLIQDKASIPVFADAGKNVFLLALQNGSKLLEGNLLEIGQENTSTVTGIAPESSKPAYVYRPANNSNNTMTGKAIYNSPLGKVKNYLNYGLVFVAVLGIIVFIWSKKHGQKRKNTHQAETRRRMGLGQSHIRDGGLSQGTYHEDPQGLHRPSEGKQRHHHSKRRELPSRVSQGGQAVEHIYRDGDAR